MTRSKARLTFMLLVCGLFVFRTARAEEPPSSPPSYQPPPQMAPPTYYAPYPAPPYAAAPYGTAPYGAAPYPVAPYPVAPYPVAPYPVSPPTRDTGTDESCSKDNECSEGHMCSEGHCVPYRTEGYGGLVALGHVLLGPVGSSAVHFGHRQVGKGFLSLGAGTGSFLMGGMLFCNGIEHCDYGEFIAGAMLGYITFAVIDSVFIAKRKVPDARFAASPVIVPTQNGVTGGVRARF